jgi:hypothetical protein
MLNAIPHQRHFSATRGTIALPLLQFSGSCGKNGLGLVASAEKSARSSTGEGSKRLLRAFLFSHLLLHPLPFLLPIERHTPLQAPFDVKRLIINQFLFELKGKKG